MSANAEAPALVQEFEQRIDQRLAELEPSVSEYNQLLAWKNQKTSSPQESSPARTRSRNSRGRRGQRREEFIEVVRANPGITIPQAAQKMGLDTPAYLYRLRDKAIQDGVLRIDGSAIFPTGEGTTNEREKELAAAGAPAA